MKKSLLLVKRSHTFDIKSSSECTYSTDWKCTPEENDPTAPLTVRAVKYNGASLCQQSKKQAGNLAHDLLQSLQIILVTGNQSNQFVIT